MLNKWNQSKQKATGLILFITHPRVSNASPDIHSHMERGNPAGPPRWAGPAMPGQGHTASDWPLSLPWPLASPGHIPVLPSLSSHCLGTLSLLLGTAPATHSLGMVPRSSQGMWSGGRWGAGH